MRRLFAVAKKFLRLNLLGENARFTLPRSSVLNNLSRFLPCAREDFHTNSHIKLFFDEVLARRCPSKDSCAERITHSAYGVCGEISRLQRKN